VGMEAAIRFSQAHDRLFLHVDVAGKILRLCEINETKEGHVKYNIVHSSSVPGFRAFEWHPVDETLVAVGQAGGEAALVKIAEGKQDTLPFSVRIGRLCNSVALNSQNLIAAGLDKVRTDFCLNIWDFNQRLPASGTKGFSKGFAEPLHKLASGEPISSLKFFQDDPPLLVAGVKGQFIRLYDLREPSVGNGLQFATRCVHNLAIDSRDENYFASCYPSNDPSISLWDRRMISGTNILHTGFGGVSHPENRQPEVSLEFKHVIDNPGSVWTLRFSKTQRGCLGVLSSIGQMRIYDVGKDFAQETYRVDAPQHQEKDMGHKLPHGLYLDRAREIYRPYFDPFAPQDELGRVVSFDFMTTQTRLKQPKIITLGGTGEVKVTACHPLPEPLSFSSTGMFGRGSKIVRMSNRDATEVGESIDKIRRHAEPQNSLKQAFKQSRHNKSKTYSGRMSSFANQAWNTDLGFFENNVSLQDLLVLSSAQVHRCEAGYLINPTKNKAIISDSHWLQSFWAWIERADKVSRHGNLTQDNLDMSYIGVFGIWMEEISRKTRQLGSSPHSLERSMENLTRRLNLSVGKICTTEKPAHRRLCLHTSGLAWSYEELEATVNKLVSQNQHTKAAAMAIFADERKLAYQALRGRTATQSHKMLAMAIAGAGKRAYQTTDNDTASNSNDVDDWSETIASLAEELTDPYARAILAFVKSGDWSAVIAENSLPLKYRVGVALRHLDDSELTRFVSRATEEAITAGDVEGVVLTGTGTKQAFDLLANYVDRFGDLQTAVLALTPTIPRYIDDEAIRRRFDSWREIYRSHIMSWNLKFDRVRFDIASQKLAVDVTGRKLIEPPKPQIRLVCAHCSQSLAQFEPHPSTTNRDTEASNSSTKIVNTATNPLTSEKAAALGTVCPKCGRHLPRCGVCDLWLGSPDESHMRWYKGGSIDLGASMTGSVQTTIGPTEPESEKEKDEDEARQKERQYEEMMRRFTVFCVKCSHGFHAAHAKAWFDGRDGRKGHNVCPVPTCDCVCKEP